VEKAYERNMLDNLKSLDVSGNKYKLELRQQSFPIKCQGSSWDKSQPRQMDGDGDGDVDGIIIKGTRACKCKTLYMSGEKP